MLIDFTFVLKDGPIGAHKMILKVSGGKYFEPIFSEKFKQQNSVQLPEFSLEAMKQYSDYVYVGTSILQGDNVDLGVFYDLGQFFQNETLVQQILDIFNCQCTDKDLPFLVALNDLYPSQDLGKIISALQSYIEINI